MLLETLGKGRLAFFSSRVLGRVAQSCEHAVCSRAKGL